MKFIKLIMLGVILSTVVFAKEKIIFWHSMSGQCQTVLNKIVDDYNRSQNIAEVQAVYKGNYEETLEKFKSASKMEERPHIVQTYDIANAFMSKSGFITPMDYFIKDDNFNINKLEYALLDYYTFNGKLYSMPFNSSSVILMYNKDAFKKAGLDPEKPPRTYEEFEEAAKKLTIKDSNGNVERYGAALIMDGWFMAQFFANEAVSYLDEENGRVGKNATKVVYEQNLSMILTWLRRMYKEGVATSYGRDSELTKDAFTSGKVAMFLESSSELRDVINRSKFEVGAGVMLNETGIFNGTLIGGGSLWITNFYNRDTQKETWNFIKYLVSKDVQVEWSMNTGYYPVSRESYNTDTIRKNRADYPQFKVAFAEMKETIFSYETLGAFSESLPELRKKVTEAMEATFEGKEEIDKIVEKTVTESNAIIKRDNDN